MSIRPIGIGDAESFRRCLDSVAREKQYLAQTEAPPLEQIERFIRDGIASQATQFVAVDPGRVVGWADVFPSWAHAVSHRGTLGMGVLPGHRGQGIGEQLLRACLTAARARGITRIELEARADNAAAIGLYEKLGFVHEALLRNAMRFDGVYHDAVRMSFLQLDPGQRTSP